MATRVIPDPAGLEVVEPTTTYHLGIVEDHLKHPTDSAIEGEVDGSVAVAQPSTHRERNPQRSRLWIVGIVAVILVSLGAILGAILGTKLHHPTAPTSTVTITPSPEPSPTAIRHNSALAVTGWRNGAEFSIRLFFQGNDGYLRISSSSQQLNRGAVRYYLQSPELEHRSPHRASIQPHFWRSQFGNMPISYIKFCTNKCSSSKQSFSI
jgi:hypothetical protein